MARHKDVQWNLPEGVPNGRGATVHSWESIQTAVLMDIRDELQRLNGLLHCSHFIAIPKTLREIARHTTRRPRKKKP